MPITEAQEKLISRLDNEDLNYHKLEDGYKRRTARALEREGIFKINDNGDISLDRIALENLDAGLWDHIDKPALQVLSFSGGKQSSALLWMVLRGDIEVDKDKFIVLNADPGMENSNTYEYIDMMFEECEKAGIFHKTVEGGNLYEDIVDLKNTDKTRLDNPPYWTKDKKTGSRGRLVQKCTYEYKIRPMKRELRRIMEDRFDIGADVRRMPDNFIEKWIGFSYSEVMRVKPADQKFIYFRYPLIEMEMNNDDVTQYFKENNLPIPERSVCNACISGDSKIIVKDKGLVNIQDMTDQSFLVWGGNKWEDTTAIYSGERETVKIETNTGLSLRLTPDHKIQTRDKGWVPAGELQIDDKLVRDLPDDYPFSNNGNNLDFMLGNWTGYILGDGSVVNSKYPLISLVCGDKDAHDLQSMIDVVNSLFGSKSNLRDATPRKSSSLVNTKNKSGGKVIQWRRKDMFKALVDIGYDISKKNIPSELWTKSYQFVSGFLSGLFSTDGCVSTRGRRVDIILASIRKSLLRDVQQLLFAMGISSTITKGSNSWRIEEGYNPIYRLVIGEFPSVCRFSKMIPLYSTRKREKLNSAISFIGEKRPHTMLPKVDSIEDGLYEPVYDLVNVGSEHKFVAQGITVHNCFANGLSTLYDMYKNRPSDWREAVRVDESVRNWSQIHVKDEVYVSSTLIPLKVLGQNFDRYDEDNFQEMVKDIKGEEKDLENDYSCDSGYCFV